MHPVLGEIPVPKWHVALAPWLVALSILALIVCELGRRSKSRDLFGLGLFGALVALGALGAHRGERVELGPIPIYSFGALLSGALLAGWITTVRFARRDGLADGATVAGCLAATVSGFAGARLLYVLTNLDTFDAPSEVVAFQNGGLTFYGGLAAGALASFVALRRRRASWPTWADAAAPGVALATGIGRVGCYFAGCDYGKPLASDAPAWLKRLGTFPRWPEEVAGAAAGSPAWLDHVMRRGLPLSARASLPVHPTELYEALACAALFALLVVLRPRRRFAGQLALVFALGYGALRFLLEALRDDPERGLWGPLSSAQWIAITSWLSAAIALWFFARLRKAAAEVSREP